MDDASTTATQWATDWEAKSRLYGMLLTVTSEDALLKVENPPSHEHGSEAWRRLARHFDPTGAITEIDRLNTITEVTKCDSMTTLLNIIETWEQAWAKYDRSTATRR